MLPTTKTKGNLRKLHGLEHVDRTLSTSWLEQLEDKVVALITAQVGEEFRPRLIR